MLPVYSAVIGCTPTASPEVTNVALPLLSMPEPSRVEPFLKLTVPLGVPLVDVTLAVNVTAASNVDGFKEEASAVVVVLFTAWVRVPDLLARSVTLPE